MSDASIVLLIAFLIIVGTTQSVNGLLSEMNVGTVLFSDSDNDRDCWDLESVTLLTSRMILEDLMPHKRTIVIQDNAFIKDITEYYRFLLEVIKNTTYGKTKRILLLAISDILGGYLNRFVLPTARYSYYAGYINFASMEKLYKLFEELRSYLRTDATGWAMPVRLAGGTLNIEPLTLPSGDADPKSCELLVMPVKLGSECANEIPLPFTNHKNNPVSIAVPFKTTPMVGIETKAAAYILVKYYLASIKCLTSRNANRTEINMFNSDLLFWMRGYVIPLLDKNKFYSAFGGVLRLVETLRGMDVTVSGKKISNYNIMPEREENEKFQLQALAEGKSNLILIILLATIFVWFLLGSIFICYRIKSGKKETCPCGPAKECKKGSEPKVHEEGAEEEEESTTAATSEDKKCVCSKSCSSVESGDSKKKGKCKFICYVGANNQGLPKYPKSRRGSLRSDLTTSSYIRHRDRSNKTSTASKIYTLEEEEHKTYAIQTSFSDVTSSLEGESRDNQIVIDYDIDTTSTSSTTTSPSESTEADMVKYGVQTVPPSPEPRTHHRSTKELLGYELNSDGYDVYYLPNGMNCPETAFIRPDTTIFPQLPFGHIPAPENLTCNHHHPQKTSPKQNHSPLQHIEAN
ncbi:hypothetical protein FQA39_LY08108 [Lamprigera yunnana]|nr:hypothetical protein FQA39_LY08108 [Lamprigera yunnana]